MKIYIIIYNIIFKISKQKIKKVPNSLILKTNLGLTQKLYQTNTLCIQYIYNIFQI